jgi:DNA-binding MarR family transcriptional regulator
MRSRGKQPKQSNAGEAKIMLGLLDALERDGGQSQRGLASELGIALGLVNSYLARCIKKGWIKARQAPARRYFYYLTPQGFVEKSQLTVQFLTSSLGFFREAKQDCLALFAGARAQGFIRLLLAGKSDLAEIAVICAADSGVEIAGMVDATGGRFQGMPVFQDFAGVDVAFDAVMVTDVGAVAQTVARAVTHVGAGRVLVPGLLHGRIRRENAA